MTRKDGICDKKKLKHETVSLVTCAVDYVQN